ncbi:amidohydrolase family protein [Bosea sp. (in: a-proteobacteria)]|uniref:amidohydrolase family protein n=1 Tax=Bosea sp. (in: a-proteobacteria) TaxID=1871050 RepID=UPI0027369A50|nr:amidohydrolase family protein [Bosea sp. (in: a-proteobacteria)]MDP3408394.1 amidohydrolase family protein [Bosea sp. (in: a-proteobacteria)]
MTPTVAVSILGNAVVVPVDGTRRVIDSGHVVVGDGAILSVGAGPWPGESPPQAERIDLDGAILIPGLIDLHLHAGHGLTKNLGGPVDNWMATVGDVYALHSDVEFWAADAALQALERLKGGTTLAVPFFGGGDNVMRSEDPIYAAAHLAEIEASGLREVLVMGVDRPPFPKTRRDWRRGSGSERAISLADQIATIEQVCASWRGAADGRIDIAVSAPVVGEPAFREADGDSRIATQDMLAAVWDLVRRSQSRLIQDGHREGSVAFMADAFGLFDERSVLAHCIDLTEADIATFVGRGAAAVYTPSSLMAVFGYCPAPRLVAAGLRVGLGTDGPAPDRSLDMFRTMFMAHRHQAIRWRDPSAIDAWTVLEMATRGGAAALGLADSLGSIEPGKRADLVAVSRRAAHLYPPDLPVERLVFFAHAGDVSHVMVDGRLLLRGHVPVNMDAEAVLDRAARAYSMMKQRAEI